MPNRERDRRRLTDRHIRSLIPHATRPYPCYDSNQRGLVLLVHPSGRKSFTCYYRHGGRARWHHIADASVGIAAARRLAAAVLLEAAQGRDPAAERKADRRAGTFAQLHQLYLRLAPSGETGSWRQADYLIRAHVLPHLGRCKGRRDRARRREGVLARSNDRPATANQTLAAISAVYSWAIAEEIGGVAANPCARVRRHPMRARERVLSDGEIALVWPHLDSTSRLILLTGARIGEVVHMRSQDVADGVWSLPGAPASGWPGLRTAAAIEFRCPSRRSPSSRSTSRAGRTAGDREAARPALARARGAAVHLARFATDVRHAHGPLRVRQKAVDRLLNHSDRSVSSIYDRFSYDAVDKRIVEAVARHVMRVASGAEADNVVRLK